MNIGILPGWVPWVCGTVLGAVLSGAVVGLYYRAELATEKAGRAEDARKVSDDRGEALLKAHTEAEKASGEILGRIDRASKALARATAQIPVENQRVTDLILETSANERYACRRLPLPGALLDSLRRPGDLPAAGGGKGPGTGTAPGVVPDAGVSAAEPQRIF